jgi:hypothetical protein
MALGPGKYDRLATIVREESGADAVIVLVLGGKMGSGFSVQSRGVDLTAMLPGMLRKIADDIEKDTSKE